MSESIIADASDVESTERPRSYARRVVTSPRGVVSIGWILIVVIASFFANWLAPHDPLKQDLNHCSPCHRPTTSWAPMRSDATS